jgi:putative flavoprotein involved in K+ transport
MEPGVLDAVVVGAGWAGLGASHALALRGVGHRVLEAGRIGETWRTQRWDSFRMNTPNVQTVMPGDRYEGADPEAVMTRDAFVALLEDFARRHALPVETGVAVTGLAAAEGGFALTTSQGPLQARAVVIAGGSLNRPKRPDRAADLPGGLHQIDASDYRNAAALSAGAVLVVGTAQTGGQIAEDLAEAGRRVFLATGRTGRVPRRYRGRDISLWLVDTGLFDLPRQDAAARPMLGADHTISLQSLSARGVVLLGRFTGVEGGRLHFAGDLEANLRFADEASAAVRQRIDEHIADAGLDAPAAVPDPAEVVAARLPDPPIRALDPAAAGIGTVIWCTGFRGDFGWVGVPGVIDASGRPVHDAGVSPVPGICFAGLDFGVSRRSGTILAVAEEAPRLVGHLLESGVLRERQSGASM